MKSQYKKIICINIAENIAKNILEFSINNIYIL